MTESAARFSFLARLVKWMLLIVVFLGIIGFSLSGWAPARALAVEVRDYFGLRLVEGQSALLERAAAESEVDPYLLGGIMYMESRGRGGQRSSAGALGLMQLVPAAAADAAKRLGLPEPTEDQLLEDDELNVRLGASHLRWLLDHRGEWSMEQVLVSYNAGRSRLFGWMDDAGGYPAWREQQVQAKALGETTSGALSYALGVLEVARTLRARGSIRAPATDGPD